MFLFLFSFDFSPFFYGDDDDDIPDVEAIFMVPPDANVLTDEDSGDEEENDPSKLNRNQLLAESKFTCEEKIKMMEESLPSSLRGQQPLPGSLRQEEPSQGTSKAKEASKPEQPKKLTRQRKLQQKERG